MKEIPIIQLSPAQAAQRLNELRHTILGQLYPQSKIVFSDMDMERLIRVEDDEPDDLDDEIEIDEP